MSCTATNLNRGARWDRFNLDFETDGLGWTMSKPSIESKHVTLLHQALPSRYWPMREASCRNPTIISGATQCAKAGVHHHCRCTVSSRGPIEMSVKNRPPASSSRDRTKLVNDSWAKSRRRRSCPRIDLARRFLALSGERRRWLEEEGRFSPISRLLTADRGLRDGWIRPLIHVKIL